MGLMENLTKVFDRAWEDLIYDRATELYTLMDIDEIAARYLNALAPLLGFTADISLPATDEELRKVLRNAATFWAAKPTERAVVDFAIRMVTGNRFYAFNFFDFRMQADHTVITEEMLGFDPWVISFQTVKLSGDSLSIGSQPGEWEISSEDLAATHPQGWKSKHEFAFLLVHTSTQSPSNIGIYEIDSLVVGDTGGTIKGVFPGGGPEGPVDWTVIGHAGEYLTEVRLVDEARGTLEVYNIATAFSVSEKIRGINSGATAEVVAVDGANLSLKRIRGRFEATEIVDGDSGGEALVSAPMQDVLNRPLLRKLMDLARLSGERIDIVYIGFLDMFYTVGDIDQWSVVAGNFGVPIAGSALLESTGRVITSHANPGDWEDQVVKWRFTVDDPETITEFMFGYTDVNNHYFVRVDYDPKGVSLWKVVAGTPTQLGSTVGLPILKAGVAEVLRVDMLKEGSGTRIRVRIAGDLRLDENDSAGAFSSGNVGVYASSKDVTLQMVEVDPLPLDVDRVGPNP